MTDKMTFHPELEAVFGEAMQRPTLLCTGTVSGIAMSKETFDEMAARAGSAAPTRIISIPAAVGDLVLMPEESYATLLDHTQVVSPVEAGADLMADFEV